MKKILLILFAFALLVSCRNEEEEMLKIDQFVGTWNWAATTGGLDNINETPQNTGKTASITFTNDNKYVIKENDKIVSEGTYRTYLEITNTDHVQRVFIDFSDYPDKAVRSVTSTTLNLYDDVADGLDYYYAK